MAGNRNSGRKKGSGKGVLRKTVEQHKLDGTFRADRHGNADSGMLDIPPKPPGKVMASKKSQQRWIRLEADERAFRDGCRFNEPLAEHVCNFFRKFLQFSKGEWRGLPFELTPWQRDEIIFPLFGWVRPDGTRRFRRSYIEVPKKNYKSTTASGIGLYMLIGDEEGGAEIYSTGADKDQARIVHSEAIRMVEVSEELGAVLNINRTTGNISYDETQSFYRALSASPRGKHGLNIHCAILDELHEWYGTDLWDSLKYGYRARRQPLELVITNAGNDTGSVCYRVREKAKAILAGKFFDNAFFAIVLSVDEAEANKEINAVANGSSDLSVAKKCNPGLGHVICEEDFLNDIQDVIQTPSEKPNFLRLSYGVWATAVNPWLDSSRWRKCREHYTESDLLGRACYGGLDLAKTQDMTALVLCFADGPERFFLLPYFWMPEDTTTDPKNPNNQLYRQWVDAGYLLTTPGSACDYGYLRRDIAEIFSKFDVKGFAYDDMYADAITQSIHEGVIVDGKILEEGTGVERIKFSQTLTTFTGPTTEFERLVINGKLIHNGHPILDWQADHVTVLTDSNNNKRPVKPKHHDHRKIDGIVAAIMALGLEMESEKPQESVYATRGFLFIEDDE